MVEFVIVFTLVLLASIFWSYAQLSLFWQAFISAAVTTAIFSRYITTKKVMSLILGVGQVVVLLLLAYTFFGSWSYDEIDIVITHFLRATLMLIPASVMVAFSFLEAREVVVKLLKGR